MYKNFNATSKGFWAHCVFQRGPVFRSADDDLYQHVYKNIKVIDTTVRYILTKQCLWHYVQVIWRAAKLLVVPNETVHRWTIRTWFDIDVYKNKVIDTTVRWNSVKLHRQVIWWPRQACLLAFWAAKLPAEKAHCKDFLICGANNSGILDFFLS